MLCHLPIRDNKVNKTNLLKLIIGKDMNKSFLLIIIDIDLLFKINYKFQHFKLLVDVIYFKINL